MAKANTLCCLVWLLLALALRADDFEAANQLYDQGKFAEAKTRYEKLFESGQWSANLFYNLANTEHRLGAPGAAMLNYERALALESGHVEARANLQWMRQQSGSKLPPPAWWDYAFLPLSGSAFALLAVVAGWGAIFAATGSWLGHKNWGWFICAVLLAGYGAAGIWWREQAAAVAVITAKEAVARLAPADRASLADTLPAGSRVRVLSERGEWIYCALPDATRGWISSRELGKIPLKK